MHGVRKGNLGFGVQGSGQACTTAPGGVGILKVIDLLGGSGGRSK